MATETEIKSALKTLWGAGLRNSPDEKRLPDIVATWKRGMLDVPPDILAQAVDDYVLTEPFWPSVAEFRTFAASMKKRNGKAQTSAFVDRESHPRAAPLWTRIECDRLESEIGYLLKKRFDEWTDADRVNYEKAIGAKLGSEEEHKYWSSLYSAAYYSDAEREADACTA